MKPKSIPWILYLARIAGWIPLVTLTVLYAANQLGFNPIRRSIQLAGDFAIAFLIMTLACPPVYTVTGYEPIRALKRPLGLFTFLYAAVHFGLFTGLDYQFNLRYIFEAISGNWFIWMGISAFLILLVLAVFSFRRDKHQLIWEWVNRLIYLAAILAVVHYGMALKGNLFKLQGDYIRPLITALVLFILLVFRLPFVEKAFQKLRKS